MKFLNFLIVIFPLFVHSESLQDTVFLYNNRNQTEKILNRKIINSYLEKKLSDSTEELWASAFSAAQILNRKDEWYKSKINIAVKYLPLATKEFKHKVLEIIFPLAGYEQDALSLLNQENDPEIFAMCGEYLLKSKNDYYIKTVRNASSEKLKTNPQNIFYKQLLSHTNSQKYFADYISFFDKDYLKGNVIVISLQRKNRNYPGLTFIRNKEGEFITAVPQLARSISGLPSYIKNGNTPQGVFRMDGLGKSQAEFIGPTLNIQLTMPGEYDARHFYKDSTIDSLTTDITFYKSLLPDNYKNYDPAFEAYYAGLSGRTEIIAHGTTLKPSYYFSEKFYPYSPTLGCLSTLELWNDNSGLREMSDQQKLVDAVTSAGGADGYYIVIDIDDSQKPVTADEVFLKLNKQIL